MSKPATIQERLREARKHVYDTAHIPMARDLFKDADDIIGSLLRATSTLKSRLAALCDERYEIAKRDECGFSYDDYRAFRAAIDGGKCPKGCKHDDHN